MKQVSKSKIINNNQYLLYCQNKLQNISNALFIHGVSFSENDKHVFECVKNNKNLKYLCVGIFEYMPEKEKNRIISYSEQIKDENKNIEELIFYYSTTAPIWDNPEIALSYGTQN